MIQGDLSLKLRRVIDKCILTTKPSGNRRDSSSKITVRTTAGAVSPSADEHIKKERRNPLPYWQRFPILSVQKTILKPAVMSRMFSKLSLG